MRDDPGVPREPVIERVVSIDQPPPGTASGDRRVVVRWSDGREAPALNYFSDKILISEGDLIGLTEAQVRALHFRRDREWLQRDD